MSVNPTPNYKLSRPNFNSMSWHDETNGNFTVIDALFKAVGLTSVEGAWLPNTYFDVNTRVIDPVDGSTWQTLIAHTSGIGTFAEDRAAHPFYWGTVATGVVVRQQFVTGADYLVGDFVYDVSEYLGGIVMDPFVGGANLRTNIADIGIIYDVKAIMATIAGYASAASGYATATAADRVQTGLDRVATGQDKVATAADRVQTGLDKTATAADRVQTGLDRVATAADRVQTGLDRVATGNDKTATAADRVQTGLDKVATAADRVQTGLDRTATANTLSAAGLPAVPVALNYLRRNAANTAYENRTPLQAHSDLLGLWEQIGSVISIVSATAVVDWTNLSAYRQLRLSASIRGSNDTLITALLSTDNGATWLSSYAAQVIRAANTTVVASGSTEAYMRLSAGTVGSATTRGMDCTAYLSDFNMATRPTKCRADSVYLDDGGILTVGTNVASSAVVACNALRVVPAAGTISDAILMLEGIRG